MSSPLVSQVHLSANQPPPVILVVEDNIVNQSITVNQLAGLGYAADVVQNGQEALEALGPVTDWPQGHPPYRLIFMDCNMPIMDGYQATQEIRRLETMVKDRYGEEERDDEQRSPFSPTVILPPSIAIVALTANVMATDRVRAFSVGMDDYLSKPVTVDALKRTVERWLAVRSVPAVHEAGVTAMSNVPGDKAMLHGQGSTAHQSFLPQHAMVSHLGSQPSMPQHGVSQLASQIPLSQSALVPENSTLSHLDWSYLHDLSDSDHDFEMTLLELFLEDCQEQVNRLKEAIAQANLTQIEKIAHYIKGASANVGAQYMQHHAHQIEQQVRHTQLTCFGPDISRLETSLSIVQDMFAAQQEQHRA